MRFLFFILLPALLTSCPSGEDDPVPDAGTTCSGDFYVSAGTGSDMFPGTRAKPYKTITTALSFAGAGQTVCVLPGTYDVVLGEVFPIVIPQGVILTGDVANNGDGVTPTQISGGGNPPGFPAGTIGAAVVLSLNTTLSGFSISVPQGDHMGIGGIGVITDGGDDIVIDSNTIHDISFDDDAWSGGGGIYAAAGSVTVKDNIFFNIQDGIALVNSNVSLIARNNRFNECSDNCVYVNGTPAVDLGTVSEPGNNIFQNSSQRVTQDLARGLFNCSGTIVYAVGNTWNATALAPGGIYPALTITNAGDLPNIMQSNAAECGGSYGQVEL